MLVVTISLPAKDLNGVCVAVMLLDSMYIVVGLEIGESCSDSDEIVIGMEVWLAYETLNSSFDIFRDTASICETDGDTVCWFVGSGEGVSHLRDGRDDVDDSDETDGIVCPEGSGVDATDITCSKGVVVLIWFEEELMEFCCCCTSSDGRLLTESPNSLDEETTELFHGLCEGEKNDGAALTRLLLASIMVGKGVCDNGLVCSL